jgi:hypothetical protein
MQHITSTIGLKGAIQQLEVERELEGLQLKRDLQYVCKSLNPFNILSSALEKAASPLLLLDNIIGTTLKLVTIYLTKKLVIGKSENKFRLLAGSLLQFTLIRFIVQHKDQIESTGRFLIYSFYKKKK